MRTPRKHATNSTAWRKIRAQILRRDPLCVLCLEQGIGTESQDCDHKNGDPNDNRTENLRGLCRSCHSSVTWHAMHGIERKSVSIDGTPTGWE